MGEIWRDWEVRAPALIAGDTDRQTGEVTVNHSNIVSSCPTCAGSGCRSAPACAAVASSGGAAVTQAAIAGLPYVGASAAPLDQLGVVQGVLSLRADDFREVGEVRDVVGGAEDLAVGGEEQPAVVPSATGPVGRRSCLCAAASPALRRTAALAGCPGQQSTQGGSSRGQQLPP